MMSTVSSPKPGLDLVGKSGSKSNQLTVSKSSATAVKGDSSAVTSFESRVKASTPGAAVKTKAEVIRKAPVREFHIMCIVMISVFSSHYVVDILRVLFHLCDRHRPTFAYFFSSHHPSFQCICVH